MSTLKKIDNVIEGYKACVVFNYEGYKVKIDSDVNLGKVIGNCKFSFVDPSVGVENFKDSTPCTSREVVVWLASFEYKLSSTRAIEKLDWMGLRPATLLEMVALVEKLSSKLIYAKYVCLGSIYKFGSGGKVPVVDINKYQKRRTLSSTWWGDGWTTDYQFVAVAK